MTFRLLSAVLLGSIQFEAQYGRNVRFPGEGTDVECEPLAGAFWVVSDSGEIIDKFTKIRAGMIDGSGVAGPADLLACRVRYADTPASSNDIQGPFVEDASDPGAVLLDPLPELGVFFDCPLVTTTTTSSTSTTTTTVVPGTPRCGRPVDACGPRPSATDALVVLFAAVGILDGGTETVTCPLCRCDLDGSGAVTATDALATLRKVVGTPAPTLCPSGDECRDDVGPRACPA